MSLDPYKKEGAKKTETRAKGDSKKYQIDGSNRKRTDWIVIEHKGEADKIEL